MAVPDTNTFDLLTVINVIGLGTGDGLQECFDDSDDSEFDSSYNPNSDGTDNNLLNFRNYNAGTTNTLTVETTSTGSLPAIPFAHVANQSVDDQDVTFTWKYVSNSYDEFAPTVRLGGPTGAIVSVGYTTGSITENLSDNERYGTFYPEDIFFVYYYQSDDRATFEFTLTSAEIDTVPSSPDNKTDVVVPFTQ